MHLYSECVSKIYSSSERESEKDIVNCVVGFHYFYSSLYHEGCINCYSKLSIGNYQNMLKAVFVVYYRLYKMVTHINISANTCTTSQILQDTGRMLWKICH